ncbi:MAG: 23S rRNA (pseudouridine(1915)-N(3))-methyltransferase RlmH [Bacteroidales bacterium]|jgi:23S rRNA (pseudouridine1915-N3)-methyltransferase|nr:23S rRNA (pseudouridine(1915)-N(3))-methyltransferase RlmH [Bacteroidales bacterium]
MNIKLVLVGQTDVAYVRQAVEEYCKRLTHYVNLTVVVINPPKANAKTPIIDIKQKEGDLILKLIAKERGTSGGIKVVLLDEQGTPYRSMEFADFLQKQMNQSLKMLIFVVGGAYGFSQEVYRQADAMLSLSKMTFSHQLIRILLLEQIYRAFTIINNEPYHNE